MRALRRLPVVLLIAGTLGCDAGSGDVDAARNVAEGYLEAVTGASEDRGWEHILPDSRRAFDGVAQYVRLAEEADWRGFSWELMPGGDSCEDGGVYCVVRLEIPNAPDSVPAFLVHPPNAGPRDTFSLFRFDADPASPGNAEIVVFFTPGGSSGILLGGG